MEKEKELYRSYNREVYADFYNELNFAGPEELLEVEQKRGQLLQFLNEHAEWGYKGSKVDCSLLSPGCQLCGSGSWSCLFINGVCNANCFYCPSPQNEEDEPTTQTITFPNAEDYIDYLRTFGFKGVSISGGEPLLTFEKTVHFIKKIREAFEDNIYIWLYTNGILVTEERLKDLRNAGLDEVRFDIGAVGFKTDKVELARRYMDTVTVEIPAVPEEVDKLKQLVRHFEDIGVDYLNLHQIRCTPHNYKKLVQRGYSFLHGPQITVLESELTALEIVKYVREERIGLPVNYCSSVYKYRYQRMAARKRHAPYIIQPFEEITETGMIRSLAARGETHVVRSVLQKLENDGIPQTDYHMPLNQNKICFKRHLWDYFMDEGLEVLLGYYRPILLPRLSYRNMFREIKLNASKKVVIERATILKDYELEGEERKLYESLFIKQLPSSFDQKDKKKLVRQDEEVSDFLIKIYDYEKLRQGLQDYY